MQEQNTTSVSKVSSTIREIPLKLIDPNPGQPRKVFDQDKVAELAESIKVNGILQPILIRPVGTRYTIIAGERRWRAAQEAGLTSIKAEIRNVSEADAAVLALTENMQRQDLDALEIANGLQRLIAGGVKQADLPAKLGVSKGFVSHHLALLSIPGRWKEAMIRPDEHGRVVAEAGIRELMRLRMLDVVSTQRPEFWSSWAEIYGINVIHCLADSDPNRVERSRDGISRRVDRILSWLDLALREFAGLSATEATNKLYDLDLGVAFYDWLHAKQLHENLMPDIAKLSPDNRASIETAVKRFGRFEDDPFEIDDVPEVNEPEFANVT